MSRIACFLSTWVALLASTFSRADVVAAYTNGTAVFNGGGATFVGQSFTTTTASPETAIIFSFFHTPANGVNPASGPYATGTGFLLSQPYFGPVTNLSSATPGYLGQADAAGGSYDFGSSVVLLPNKSYYFYENGAMPFNAITGSFPNPYTGGTGFYAFELNNFQVFGDADFNFSVMGTPVYSAPDGGCTALLLLVATVMICYFRREKIQQGTSAARL